MHILSHPSASYCCFTGLFLTRLPSDVRRPFRPAFQDARRPSDPPSETLGGLPTRLPTAGGLPTRLLRRPEAFRPAFRDARRPSDPPSETPGCVPTCLPRRLEGFATRLLL